MKRRVSIIPKRPPQAKKIPDATVYLTPKGCRVYLDSSHTPDPILGTKVRNVSDGKWWYLKPGAALRPEN